MKKIFVILLTVCMMLSVASALADMTATPALGVVVVETTKPCRLLVEKEGSSQYYDIGEGESIIPLQAGEGSYSFTECFKVSGKKYRTGDSVSVQYSGDENAAFMQPNIVVNYDSNTLAVVKATELCEGLEDEMKIAKKIYSYVVRNYDYDYIQATMLRSGNITQNYPDLDEVYQTHKGVCYDLSALTCAMLRSQGIPAKLAVGNGHAWVIVVIDGKELVMDVTAKIELGQSRYPNFTYDPQEIF